jgi:hypothetical protein
MESRLHTLIILAIKQKPLYNLIKASVLYTEEMHSFDIVFNLKIKIIAITVDPVYSERGYCEYPIIVNGFLPPIVNL